MPSVTMTTPSRSTPARMDVGCDPIASRMPNSRVRAADRKREHACDAHDRDHERDRGEAPETRIVFSPSGVSTSARTSSSVAARSTGCSADISRMTRVIGATSPYGS